MRRTLRLFAPLTLNERNGTCTYKLTFSSVYFFSTPFPLAGTLKMAVEKHYTVVMETL